MLCLQIDQELFKKAPIIETGLSNYHKLIYFVFCNIFCLVTPKKIKYRNYKQFGSKSFLYELDQELLKKEMYKDHNDKFLTLTNVFRYVLDKNTLLTHFSPMSYF